MIRSFFKSTKFKSLLALLLLSFVLVVCAEEDNGMGGESPPVDTSGANIPAYNDQATPKVAA